MAVAALDLWTLFVQQIFGGFFVAIIGIAVLIFIIFIMGRLSIYSSMWYLLFFLLTMTLGYGYITLNILITLSVIMSLFFSWKSYIDSK
jgi:hypothetical protein